jgi:hypothetical protein
LLVALENVQSSPQKVEHGLGFLGEAWVFYGPHQLKRKAAMQGGFNRSVQHTNHRLGGRSVADEAATTDLLFREPESADVGALEARLDVA